MIIIQAHNNLKPLKRVNQNNKQDSDSYVSGIRNQEDMDSPTGNGINQPRNNRNLDNSAQYSGDLNRSINQHNAFEQTYEDLLPKLKNDI